MATCSIYHAVYACLHTVKPLLLLQGSVKRADLLLAAVYYRYRM